MKTFTCHFCQGKRQVVNGVCSGCGSLIAVAKQRKSQKKAMKPRCPGCASRGQHHEHSDGTLVCRRCGTEFDPRDDTGFRDSRPEQNAMKNERARR